MKPNKRVTPLRRILTDPEFIGIVTDDWLFPHIFPVVQKYAHLLRKAETWAGWIPSDDEVAERLAKKLSLSKAQVDKGRYDCITRIRPGVRGKKVSIKTLWKELRVWEEIYLRGRTYGTISREKDEEGSWYVLPSQKSKNWHRCERMTLLLAYLIGEKNLGRFAEVVYAKEGKEAALERLRCRLREKVQDFIVRDLGMSKKAYRGAYKQPKPRNIREEFKAIVARGYLAPFIDRIHAAGVRAAIRRRLSRKFGLS